MQDFQPTDMIIINERKGPFTIGLVASSGTGYEWKQKLDKQDVVKFVEEKTIPLTPQRPGGPVEFRFDYNAVKDGKATATFNLLGPDKKVAKTDTIEFVVT